MASIPLRKSTNNNPSSLAAPAWDPFSEMRALLGFEPFTQPMSTFIEPAYSFSFAPAFEVKETKDAFIFKADLPGIKESDVDVQLKGDRISIHGKREAEKSDDGETYYTYERSYGSFTRSFTLPAEIDSNNVKAELKDGVLTVAVPKSPEAQAKKIAIKAEKTKA